MWLCVMYSFFRIPFEEIVENKVELRRLNPDSKSLRYITVCEMGESKESNIIYFNFLNNHLLEKSFERYTGLSLTKNTQGYEIAQVYNETIKKEVRREQWLNDPRKYRIR